MDAKLRGAIARIDVMQEGRSASRGTGTLVGDGIVLTALHVVANRRTDPPEPYPGTIQLEFPGHKTGATIVEGRWDVKGDWVLLRCAEPPVGVTPAPLQRLTRSSGAWETFGYPDANPRDGMVQGGSVEAYDGELEGTSAMQLFSRQAAAGDGAPVKGLSGAPVVVGDAVVGVLRFALMQEGKTVAGTLYACPAAMITEANPDRLQLRPADERPSKLSQIVSDVRSVRQLAVAAVLLVAALAAGAWLVLRDGDAEPRAVRHGDPSMIAVLPFRNLGGGETQSIGLSEGLQDALVTQLGRVPGLVAISPTSLRRFEDPDADVGRLAGQIGAGSIVDGSVQHAGDRVRITARLVDPASGATLWSNSYDTLLTDIFGAQTHAAFQIADGLGAALTAKQRVVVATQPTSNPAAYNAYLRGSGLLRRASGAVVWTRTKLPLDQELGRQAVELLGQAVLLDTTFALGWERLAEAHTAMYYAGFDTTQARAALAQAAAARALALAPTVPEVHRGQGLYLYRVRGDLPAALAEYEVARRGLPNDPDVLMAIGLLQRRVGSWEIAAITLSRAADLDLLAWDRAFIAGQTYELLRDYPNAVRYYRRAIAAEGEGPSALGLASAATGLTGHADSARAAVALVLSQADTAAVFASLIVPEYRRLVRLLDRPLQTAFARQRLDPATMDSLDYFLAQATLAAALDRAPARRAFAESARGVASRRVSRDSLDAGSHAALALALAHLGRADEAIASSRRALAQLQPTVTGMVRAHVTGSHTLALAMANVTFIEATMLVGRTDAGAEHAVQALQRPGFESAGWISADPLLAPLRGHPRLADTARRR